ncbi:uncharacterized protein LOC107048206 [Diachasma alloeum]|uniref:uncharacterized protein LOC107048206 n=1 Tax=Diachasma alloeum TaxID=454923 RepID=UPI0007383070|nr:uncharacterized protein LOC107048206 [Diachasma alloeum]
MKIPLIFLATLAVVILFATARADDGGDIGADYFDGEEGNSSKISASLRISDGLFKNRTEMVKGAVSTVVPSTEKEAIAARVDVPERSSRGNSTRELALPTDLSIARIITEDAPDTEEDIAETLPEAQELRFQRPGTRRRPFYRPNPPRRPPSVNRRNVFPVEAPLRSSKRPNRRPQEVKEARQPTENDCTFFSKTVCLETVNYPHEAIMRSLRGNKEMASSLLTDYSPQDGDNDYLKASPLESHFDNRFENKYENNEIKRRSDHSSPFDNVEEGFTCPSQVMYARPQLARAVSGVWKYIVNTAEHTQTLRLEKCSSPKSSCSFISENYRSSCMQVYNYHRLLTWDSSLGLHMDIFKIPSCCSCHVQGYAELYPPIQKDPRPAPEEKFPGADFATEQGEDDAFKRPTSYLTKFKPSNLDNNFVSSGGTKHIADAGSSHRPSFTLPGRPNRPKKPNSSANARPYDKLPQQHAPNTRAPGYKGPVVKGMKRPGRPVRPYRRDSTGDEEETSPAAIQEGFDQQNDQETDASTRLHNGGFDDEYQEPNRRVNYNYHPIIDFFKPEASRLQAPEALSTQPATAESNANGNSWKPMISP